MIILWLLCIITGTCIISLLYFFQGAIDLDEEAGKLPPFPQIVVVQPDDSMQCYIAVEKQILLESDSIKDSIIDLISVYLTFDIAYPKLYYTQYVCFYSTTC